MVKLVVFQATMAAWGAMVTFFLFKFALIYLHLRKGPRKFREIVYILSQGCALPNPDFLDNKAACTKLDATRVLFVLSKPVCVVYNILYAFLCVKDCSLMKR